MIVYGTMTRGKQMRYNNPTIWTSIAVICTGCVLSALASSSLQPKYVSDEFLPVQLSVDDHLLTVENGFVQSSFDLNRPSFRAMYADFNGKGQYSQNVFADGDNDPLRLGRGGLVLERHNSIQSLWTTVSASSADSVIEERENVSITIIANTTEKVAFHLHPIYDSYDHFATVMSTWTVILNRGQRNISVTIDAHVIRVPTPEEGFVGVGLSMFLEPSFIFVQYANRGGMLSTLHSTAPFYFENKKIFSRVYTFDKPSLMKGAVDIHVKSAVNVSSSIVMSGRPSLQWYGSGATILFAGKLPNAEKTRGVYHLGGWSDDWRMAANNSPVALGERWSVSVDIAANSHSFPAKAVPVPDPSFVIASQSELEELQAMLLGIYANAAGQLNTHILPGHAHSTMLNPLRTAYHDQYTFYDPDSFFTISALLHSGHEGLVQEALSLVNTSKSYMKANGQIPHHFKANAVSSDPTGLLPHASQAANLTAIFDAISGAFQTGPNLFWVLSSLRVAAATGEYEHFCTIDMKIIEKAILFIQNLIDPKQGLIISPGEGGSLWVDTLIRGNYSADSNAFAVVVLKEYSESLSFCSDRSSLQAVRKAFAIQAAAVMQSANAISEAMNKFLWVNDHYITQRNLDGTIRDFFDYDANLLAIAAGVSNLEQSKLILNRLSEGGCSASNPNYTPGLLMPQYISEKEYGPADCFKENIGDSSVSMGRIAWADGHARRRAAISALLVGDKTFYDAQLNIFQARILGPLLDDVNSKVWLRERYVCDPRRGIFPSQESHAPYYGEYGNTVSMLLHEVKYGIHIGLGQIVIDPFVPRPITNAFSWRIGGISLAPYSAEKACISITFGPSGNFDFTLSGLYPREYYAVSWASGQSLSVRADEYGYLNFEGSVEIALCATLEKEK